MVREETQEEVCKRLGVLPRSWEELGVLRKVKRPDLVFVFGSNLQGIHGAGAAAAARKDHAAEMGVGRGITGFAYAIPTRTAKPRFATLDPSLISAYVTEFKAYAAANASNTFFVTPVGTGFAAISHEVMAAMFKDSPSNCLLPREWRDIYACEKEAAAARGV